MSASAPADTEREMVVFDDDTIECAVCVEVHGPGDGVMLALGREEFTRVRVGTCGVCGYVAGA